MNKLTKLMKNKCTLFESTYYTNKQIQQVNNILLISNLWFQLGNLGPTGPGIGNSWTNKKFFLLH